MTNRPTHTQGDQLTTPHPPLEAADRAVDKEVAHGLTTPKPESGAAQTIARMNAHMTNDKLNLSIGQLEAVKKVESMIMNGDSKGLESYMKSLGGHAKDAEKVMKTVTNDLASVGIKANWDYTTKTSGPGYGEGYHLSGHDDVGHLSLYHDGGDGKFTKIDYPTEGTPSGITRPIPTKDGRMQFGPDGAVSPADPASWLSVIKNDGLPKH